MFKKILTISLTALAFIQFSTIAFADDSMLSISNDGTTEEVIPTGETSADPMDATEPTEATIPFNINSIPLNPADADSTNNSYAILGDKDTRSKVADPQTKSPYKSIVFLEIEYPGFTFRGTGVMIDENTVLTAAHNLYSPVDGGWAKKITVYAGYDGKGKFIGKASSTKMYAIKKYLDLVNEDDSTSKKQSHQYDIGAIKLDSNLGTKTGTVGYGTFAQDGASVTTAGFPIETEETKDQYDDDDEAILNYDLYSSTGTITSLNKEQPEIRYTNDTTGGQSGAPLWISTHSNSILGIHIGGKKSLGYNQAVPITTNNFAFIQQWTGNARLTAYNKSVILKNPATPIWKTSERLEQATNSGQVVNKVVYAKDIYTDSNENTYLEIYDQKNGKRLGLISKGSTLDVDNYNQRVKIKKEEYKIWKDYQCTQPTGMTTTGKLNKEYLAYFQYKHDTSGRTYLVLYDTKTHKFVGILNKNATDGK